MKYLDEGDYFICSDGLVPTKLYAGQTKTKSKGGYMLTNKSTSTQSLGDFSCRWTAVLAVAAATLVVLTGGAALVAVAVIAVGVAASGLLCGGILAGQRKWLTFNETVFITGANALNADDIMVCPLIGGTIHFAPGIDSPLKAAAVAARNATWATFEGMAIGFMAYSGGSAFLTKGATPFASFGTNLLKNYGATLTTPLGWVGRGIATLDQVYVEGMLINGESQEDAWKEHGWRGATIVEQPFINIGEKVADKKPVTWQDYYYAGLTVGTLGLIPAHNTEAANKRFLNSLERMARKIKKGLVVEGVKIKPIAEKLAKRIYQERKQAKGYIPSKVAVVIDKATGKIYEGLSGEPHPENIHPDLKSLMPEKSLEVWKTENCAEFKAVNDALWDGAKIKNLEGYTVKTKSMEAAPRCENCKQTTKGVKFKSDKK